MPQVQGFGVGEQRLTYLEEVVQSYSLNQLNDKICVRAVQHSSTFHVHHFHFYLRILHVYLEIGHLYFRNLVYITEYGSYTRVIPKIRARHFFELLNKIDK